MKRLEIKGVEAGFLTVHSGLGNYREIDVEDLTKHRMDSEEMEVTPQLVDLVNNAKDNGKQVCAIGTSVLRGIESAVSMGGHTTEVESGRRSYHRTFVAGEYTLIALCILRLWSAFYIWGQGSLAQFVQRILEFFMTSVQRYNQLFR